jgi:acetylornithine deacetylase/succinyl-diaminopimelate desuccinylase family protein
MTQTETLLRDLIALPSVNPAFVNADDAVAGEQRVAEFICATTAKAGLDVEFREVLPGRKNVFARLAPAKSAMHRILLAPHMDTVPADHEAFRPRVRNGRMYGRGACDTKGSIAAMLGALLDLAQSQNRPSATEIIFTGLIDEENAQAGSRALAKMGFRADLAIVGEPTRCRVITAHKGSLWVQLETKGKAAHGSKPELGVNAIHLMARVVEELETRYATSLKAKRHPLLGHATVSVGTIRGGSQPNIVPDRAVAQIDRRTLPGETEAGVYREISAMLRRRGLIARMNPTKAAPCLPLETDAEQPFIRRLMNCAGQSKPAGVDFFCDAAVLAAGRMPSVVFGPGDIAQAHTVNEWISLKGLEQAKGVLVEFLKSLP